MRSLRESSSAELESTRQTLQAEIRCALTQQREAEKAAEESQRKLEDAERCHSVEVQQLNLRLADTRDTLSSRVGEVEAELRAAQQQISSKNSALSDRDNELARLDQQLIALRQQLVEKDRQLVEKQVEKDGQLVEKEFNRKCSAVAKTERYRSRFASSLRVQRSRFILKRVFDCFKRQHHWWSTGTTGSSEEVSHCTGESHVGLRGGSVYEHV